MRSVLSSKHHGTCRSGREEIVGSVLIVFQNVRGKERLIVFDGWGLAAAFVRGVRCASATGAAARSAASRRTAAAAAFLLARLSQLRSSRCSRDRCAVLVARVPNLFQTPQDLAPSQTRRIRFAMVKHKLKMFSFALFVQLIHQLRHMIFVKPINKQRRIH